MYNVTSEKHRLINFAADKPNFNHTRYFAKSFVLKPCATEKGQMAKKGLLTNDIFSLT